MYDQLKNILEGRIYTNSTQLINGNYLRQQALETMIDALGVNSGFMGLLTNANKPTSAVDGKQFYLGVNNSTTAVNVNLSGVSLGTVELTQSNLWLIWSDNNGWNKCDLAEGIADTIPQNVSDLADAANYITRTGKVESSGSVTINALKSNTVYYLSNVTALAVLDYDYNVGTIEGYLNPPTYIIVKAVADMTVNIPYGSITQNAAALAMLTGKTYLITVMGDMWKIELYG